MSHEMRPGDLFAVGQETILIEGFSLIMGMGEPHACDSCHELHPPEPIFIIDMEGFKNNTHEQVKISAALQATSVVTLVHEFVQGLQELQKLGLI
jgi:hypothetical protein